MRQSGLSAGLLYLGALVFMLCAAQAAAETRIALVIGNGQYAHSPKLNNPVNDAELMAKTLESVGFTVTKLIDGRQADMKRAMLEFGRALRGSDSVGLFYYAGHGVDVRGENFLIPVDANIADEGEVAIQAVNINELMATMERAQSRINIVILDACRDNPYAASSRSGSRGLARVDAPAGSYIAFATAPKSVAQDGVGSNSPYSGALARAIATPGLTIEQVFKKTRLEVQSAVRDQTPWESSSITGEFFFTPLVPGGDTPDRAPPPPVPPPANIDDRTVELAFWNSVKDSDNVEAFRSYLAEYPKGSFARLAALRIDELSKPPAPPQAPPPAPPVERDDDPVLRGGGDVIAHSSSSVIGPGELSNLGCDQLWVARNEIYKRNGYCFQTARGRNYFGNAGCRTSSQNILSRLERDNVARIKSWESQRGCR